ncbi:hypothetical protein HME01_06970 [Vreelandella aquamarina]|uniref:Uncharacterized protein n=1 Tax=Vreelandella aquamarina TaxID=77097 RepID=A0A1N6FZX5_9GAMM|nr:DUF6270 domain-containing protein [Halomonas meridiana]GED44845.1 hypothetical protein HME01_06970 [Halomonas meridiana]SIN61045.1 hypothetical protein SAMN05878249_0462 [Halomonas meridiana]SIN66025.1 hypothetical protein SAMN05878438_1891 [Halomonas meridiana]SIO00751.1 hypothetical protein SAMN05878442_0497 [Halomonas meridiana]
MCESTCKVFIFGSCVSRDAFEYDGAGFDLIRYIARSSFASQACKSWDSQQILDGIGSSFQRRMVKYDTDKSLLKFVDEDYFDLFLIDLIDDRFDLVEYEKNCFATRSVEFVKGAKKDPVSKVGRHQPGYDKRWKIGFESFLKKMDHNKKLEKIKINQVFWAAETISGDVISGFSKDRIERENEYLWNRYSYMKQFLPKNAFLSFDEKNLKADQSHKWGVSPFHFSEVYYQDLLLKLRSSMNVMG